MTHQERQRLIALVDAAPHRDEPLLSSALAAADPQFAEAYRLSANLFSVHLPADDREQLRDGIDADIRQPLIHAPPASYRRNRPSRRAGLLDGHENRYRLIRRRRPGHVARPL
ncbi:hypothetical protein ABT133_34975 [Streptomyces sp. NPDC001835]|uniref:hypothetical protein n=1 Tax=unclassified Streptomyces TaxID=2593676 RepID=UPI00332B49EE